MEPLVYDFILCRHFWIRGRLIVMEQCGSVGLPTGLHLEVGPQNPVMNHNQIFFFWSCSRAFTTSAAKHTHTQDAGGMPNCLILTFFFTPQLLPNFSPSLSFHHIDTQRALATNRNGLFLNRGCLCWYHQLGSIPPEAAVNNHKEARLSPHPPPPELGLLSTHYSFITVKHIYSPTEAFHLPAAPALPTLAP